MNATKLENERRFKPLRKIAALFEVLGVFIAGNFVASYLGLLMGSSA